MIALVNPRATEWRARIPLSILSIGATLEGHYPYKVFDGNLDRSLAQTILTSLAEEPVRYVALTVMPGPQLIESITLSKIVRRQFPEVAIIWGGYFPTLHPDIVLQSGYVDYVIRDQGERAFVQLIDALEHGGSLDQVAGLSHRENEIRHNRKQELLDPNLLPPLPYHRVDVQRYIGRTILGTRTVNYHSSVGCPFLCGFCAVAASYSARWKGLEARRIADDLLWFKNEHRVNAVEFHDNNFFTSERRVLEFSERMAGEGIRWWGEARPDTLLQYSDTTWHRMKQAGCAMIFFGAESSSDETLRLMNKGGSQSSETVLALSEKAREFGIIPEYSFVLGNPSKHPEEDLESDIRYIRRIKQINPQAEIIIYTYSPVQFEGAELYGASQQEGFRFPASLDEWLLPEWRGHDLRKDPVTPWLTGRMRRKIRNFERVLHAFSPTKSDLRQTPFRRGLLKLLGSWRYLLRWYALPYEIAVVQRLLRYRQPEIEGF
jgi:anaerobic magnesium-protoporphyrin IX monomethyl ester cyclase